MAAPTLHLRPEEKKLFDALPAELKEGWKISAEKLQAEERPEELKMRRLMFRVEDPQAKQILGKMETAKFQGNLQELYAASRPLPKATMFEVFFTLGVKALSAMLRGLLETAKTDEDLQGVMELSAVRHALMESNAEIPSHAS